MDEKKYQSENIMHNIVMENRQNISISGVEEVVNFDEFKIVLSTQMGDLSIEGNGLHINMLNTESGELKIDGYVETVNYLSEDNRTAKTSFLARLFQ